MHPSRLTNEALRERRRRYYREETCRSLPCLSERLWGYFDDEFYHITQEVYTRNDIENAYKIYLNKFLSETKDDTDDMDETCLRELTQLQLMMEYTRHCQFCMCYIYDLRYHAFTTFTARRQLVLFAIYEGALGPDIPLKEQADEPEYFRLVGDDNIAEIDECVFAECRHLTHVGDFLQRWVEADGERARRYAFFCKMPASKRSIKTAYREMSK
jgi:hypothetical protein